MRFGLVVTSRLGVASIPTVVLFALELKLTSTVLSSVFGLLIEVWNFFAPPLSRLQSSPFIPS